MPGAEILDSSSGEILLDDGRSDVRRPADRRRIPELLRHKPHDRGDLAFLRRGGLRKAGTGGALGEVDRREERAAPRPKVLRRELLAEMELDVVVQSRACEVVEVALPAVLEDPRTGPHREKIADRGGELRVDELRPHADPRLGAKGELDALPPHAHV